MGLYMNSSLNDNEIHDLFMNKLVSSVNSIYWPCHINGDKNTMIRKYYLKRIDIGNIQLEFIKKYVLDVTYENGYYFCDINEFDIHAYGKSIEDLFDDIYCHIEFIWKRIVSLDNDRLNPVAFNQKKRMLELLRVV